MLAVFLTFCYLLAPAVFGEEICDRDIFRGRCTSGSVMAMQTARYGQYGLGPCVSTDLGMFGCGKDALSDMDGWCSGRERCDVEVDRVSNAQLNEGNTCIKEVTSYLDVAYSCIKGRP